MELEINQERRLIKNSQMVGVKCLVARLYFLSLDMLADNQEFLLVRVVMELET